MRHADEKHIVIMQVPDEFFLPILQWKAMLDIGSNKYTDSEVWGNALGKDICLYEENCQQVNDRAQLFLQKCRN